MNDLETFNGFIDDVEQKENQIRYDFIDILDHDENLISINEKLQEMIDELEESE